MKLRFSPTSPYVRKVMVTCIETGQQDRIELAPTSVWDPNTDIRTVNPLGKVPALETQDGAVLFDSPVICEYLDSLHGGDKLFPADGAARWRALRQQALADGILDASILRLLEGKRPAEQQSADWDKRQTAAVLSALDTLEAEASDLEGPFDIGRISVAVALGYLDFRYPGMNWREGRPALAAWYEGMAARPSMVETVPKDPA